MAAISLGTAYVGNFDTAFKVEVFAQNNNDNTTFSIAEGDSWQIKKEDGSTVDNPAQIREALADICIGELPKPVDIELLRLYTKTCTSVDLRRQFDREADTEAKVEQSADRRSLPRGHSNALYARDDSAYVEEQIAPIVALAKQLGIPADEGIRSLRRRAYDRRVVQVRMMARMGWSGAQEISDPSWVDKDIALLRKIAGNDPTIISESHFNELRSRAYGRAAYRLVSDVREALYDIKVELGVIEPDGDDRRPRRAALVWRKPGPKPEIEWKNLYAALDKATEYLPIAADEMKHATGEWLAIARRDLIELERSATERKGD